MKVGQPFTCTNCNAQLTWRDSPVIECEYCHTKILMKTTVRPGGGAYGHTGGGSGGRGGGKAVFIVGAALAIGVALIIVRATRSTSSASSRTPAPAAAVPVPPTPAPTPAPPPQPASIGTVALQFGEAGTNAGQLTDARALAVTPGGEIVIAEARSGRVQVFDTKGTYQKLITLPPSKLTKELTVFGAAATPDGKVVVSRAGDLLVLDVAAGSVAKTIAGDYPEVFYHGDVEVTPDGTIWAVIDRTGDLSVMHVAATGKVLSKVKRAGQHLAVDGLGTMYLAKDDAIEVRDNKGEVQRKFSQAGPDKKLHRPDAVAIDGKGHVFVAESGHVLVFDPEGAYLAELETGDIQDLAVDAGGALYVLSRDKLTRYTLALPAK